MRITDKMITNNFLRNYSGNLTNMTKLQMQLSNNKRITKISDDPTGVTQSLQVNYKINRTKQYQDNIANAQSVLKQTEASISSLDEITKRSYEYALEAANGYLTPEDKEATAQTIMQYRDEVLAIGNTKVSNKYIFGGFNTTNEPFTADASGNIKYNGLDLTDSTNPALQAENDQSMEYQIGFSMTTKASVTGTQLLSTGADNLYSVLNGLYKALSGNGSSEEISAYVGKLQTSESNLLSLQSDVGGRQSRLELVSDRYANDILNYTDQKSNIEDIDMADAMLKYKMSENVYQASLQVGSNLIQESLLNYLK